MPWHPTRSIYPYIQPGFYTLTSNQNYFPCKQSEVSTLTSLLEFLLLHSTMSIYPGINQRVFTQESFPDVSILAFDVEHLPGVSTLASFVSNQAITNNQMFSSYLEYLPWPAPATRSCLSPFEESSETFKHV